MRRWRKKQGQARRMEKKIQGEKRRRKKERQRKTLNEDGCVFQRRSGDESF
jgi:hypothetical protein